jgi:hypothetical protein
MLKSFSLLYSLTKIVFRNPRNLNLRHVFGMENSIAQDIGKFFRINLLAGSPEPLTLGENLANRNFSFLWA